MNCLLYLIDFTIKNRSTDFFIEVVDDLLLLKLF